MNVAHLLVFELDERTVRAVVSELKLISTPSELGVVTRGVSAWNNQIAIAPQANRKPAAGAPGKPDFSPTPN